MTCNDYQGLLAADLYGDNTTADREAVQTHMKTCSNCQKAAREWRILLPQIPEIALPTEENFWIQQKASILSQLPARESTYQRVMHRWAVPALAMSLLISAWGYREHSVRSDMMVAQHMDLLQNMEMLQQLDVVENLDTLEAK